MSELPILFRGEMVRAIIEGRKTQTRRVIKNPAYFGCFTGDCPHDGKAQCDAAIATLVADDGTPYGRKGDRLWLKETFTRVHPGLLQKLDPDPDSPLWSTAYRADGEPANWKEHGVKWKPSIFMPRKLSRITLEITDVRVERLNVITEQDARAEGVITARQGPWIESAVWAFIELWDSINGKTYPWASNPFVFVISFRPLNHIAGNAPERKR